MCIKRLTLSILSVFIYQEICFSAENTDFECLIEPHEEVNIGSHVEGIIESVLVDRGDTVHVGQILARLEAGVESATLELATVRAKTELGIKTAKLRYVFSEKKYKRTLNLSDKSFISDLDIDQAETEKMLAEVAVDVAKEDKKIAGLEKKRAIKVLDLRTMRSPVDGIVVKRFLSEGERIEQEPLLRIAQVDPLNIEVILPASMFGKITSGMVGNIRPEVSPEEVYIAKVTIVDQIVDAASGMFGVRLELANPNREVAAGLKCTVFFPEVE